MVIANNSGWSKSLWMEAELPSFEPLKCNRVADVCVIGAGIDGLTCAYALAKKGLSVIVIDKGAIAGGQTARTTAHLTWVLDDRFSDLESLFGIEGVQIAAESHSEAINAIERIIATEGISCDFERVDGYLFAPPDDFKFWKKNGRPSKKLTCRSASSKWLLSPPLIPANASIFPPRLNFIF
jgi:choline dehydrogenase-like flavoprotein